MQFNLYTASNQWATRPADERFWGLDDLSQYLQNLHEHARESSTNLNNLRVEAQNGDVVLLGRKNQPAQLTHWSFGQLCGMVGAPANYLRKLPNNLVCQNLNYGMNQDHAVRLLIHRDDKFLVRSLNGTDYTRIWNRDVVKNLSHAKENGWIVPPARPALEDPRQRPATEADIIPNQKDFGLSVKIGDMIAPAGVYASDRDMFIFLVNPERIIDDGNSGLMRGVFIWNTEVCAGAFKVQTFYLENVCGNHIVWGASNVTNLRIIHRGDKAKQYGNHLFELLQPYVDAGTEEESQMIVNARKKRLGKDLAEISNELYNRKSLGLTRNDIEQSYNIAVRWEHVAKSPPTSVWGFVHGLTRYSQTMIYADKRHDLDMAGGKILALAV